MSQASLSAVITTIPIASLRRGSQQPQVHDNPQVQGSQKAGTQNTKTSTPDGYCTLQCITLI